MKTSTLIWIIIVIIVLVIAGYWWSTPSVINTTVQPKVETSATDVASTSVASPNVQTAIKPALTIATDTKLGTHLLAQNDMTLYVYAKDTTGVSNCTGVCEKNWPPHVVPAGMALHGGDGVMGKISSTTRSDGSLQLTYNGKPLYFWSKDAKIGDVSGQNFGGVWSVARP